MKLKNRENIVIFTYTLTNTLISYLTYICEPLDYSNDMIYFIGILPTKGICLKFCL